jgi:molecular chaperone GrpE
MVKKTKKETTEHKEEREEIVREGEKEAPVQAAATLPSREELSRQLEEKSRECAENYDKYVRAVAELENYKKRAVKEKADAIKYGNEALIRDLLPLMDSLERALKHAEQSSDFESFKKGLAMLRDQLVCSLGKRGVEAIDCGGKGFDPNYHEAMMQVASQEHEHNQIVDELEKGYLLNGRLLRPSKVTVCKRAGDGGQC